MRRGSGPARWANARPSRSSELRALGTPCICFWQGRTQDVPHARPAKHPGAACLPAPTLPPPACPVTQIGLGASRQAVQHRSALQAAGAAPGAGACSEAAAPSTRLDVQEAWRPPLHATARARLRSSTLPPCWSAAMSRHGAAGGPGPLRVPPRLPPATPTRAPIRTMAACPADAARSLPLDRRGMGCDPHPPGLHHPGPSAGAGAGGAGGRHRR